jgi:hypothetical protein
MKKGISHLLFLVVAGLLAVETVQAQGTAFTYQGRLNTAGVAASGSYDLTFTLYATNSGGSAVAGPITNSATAVSNGLFTVTVDFKTNVFDGSARWLEIGVGTNGGGGFMTLSPRQQLMPTPYAIFANMASNLSGSLPAAQLNGTVPLGTLPTTLTNLANGNGGGLTNLDATQLAGAVPLTTLPAALTNLATGNGFGLTNLNATNLVGSLPQYPTVQIATNAPFTNAVLISPDGTNRAWGSASNIAGLGSAAFQNTSAFDLTGAGASAASNIVSAYGNTTPINMTNAANSFNGTVNGASVYDVKQFGALGAARYLFGNITSNSATVNITTGTVSNADVGRLVRVSFGRATNCDLVSTIATVSPPSQLTLNRVVSNTMSGTAILISPSDDTIAISNAVTAAVTNGGGTVYIPAGIYWVEEIAFPLIGNAYNFYPTVTIQGNLPPGASSTYFAVRPGISALVYGTETGDGNFMFGSNTNNWNNIRTGFQNLLLRAPINPNLSVIDASKSVGGNQIINCTIDTGLGENDTRIPMPTYTNNPIIQTQFEKSGSAGVCPPVTANGGGGVCLMQNVLVWGGFCNGFFGYGEHNNFEQVSVCNCWNAFVPGTTGPATFGDVDVEECYNVFNGDYSIAGYGSDFVMADLYYENIVPGWWHSTCLCEDTNNTISGVIENIRAGTANGLVVLTNNGNYSISASYGADKGAQFRPTTTFSGTNTFSSSQSGLIVGLSSGANNYSTLQNVGTNAGMILMPNNTASSTFDIYGVSSDDINNSYGWFLRAQQSGGILLVGNHNAGGSVGPQSFGFVPDAYGGGLVPVWGSTAAGVFYANGAGITNLQSTNIVGATGTSSWNTLLSNMSGNTLYTNTSGSRGLVTGTYYGQTSVATITGYWWMSVSGGVYGNGYSNLTEVTGTSGSKFYVPINQPINSGEVFEIIPVTAGGTGYVTNCYMIY